MMSPERDDEGRGSVRCRGATSVVNDAAVTATPMPTSLRAMPHGAGPRYHREHDGASTPPVMEAT
jgi:hypothetical protein